MSVRPSAAGPPAKVCRPTQEDAGPRGGTRFSPRSAGRSRGPRRHLRTIAAVLTGVWPGVPGGRHPTACGQVAVPKTTAWRREYSCFRPTSGMPAGPASSDAADALETRDEHRSVVRRHLRPRSRSGAAPLSECRRASAYFGREPRSRPLTVTEIVPPVSSINSRARWPSSSMTPAKSRAPPSSG